MCLGKQGGKLLSLGIRSLPCRAPSSLHNQQFVEDERKENCFLAAPWPGEPFGLCSCLLTVRAGGQGGHPQIQAVPRAAPTTIAQSSYGRAKKEELGAKAPLCRVHHCAHPSNPRAICKGSTFLLKDEKSLGELGKVPCEILTELQIG